MMRRPNAHIRLEPWHTALLLVAMLSLAAILSSCSAGAANNPRENLPDSLRDYHRHLVWGRYADAAGYLPEEERSVFIESFEESGEDLRITEYEIGQLDLNSEEEATVTVTLTWYQAPYYIIEETRVRETWSYDEETEYWWLTARASADEGDTDRRSTAGATPVAR